MQTVHRHMVFNTQPSVLINQHHYDKSELCCCFCSVVEQKLERAPPMHTLGSNPFIACQHLPTHLVLDLCDLLSSNFLVH